MIETIFRFIRKYKVLHIIFWAATTISLVHEIMQHTGNALSSAVKNAVIIQVWSMASVYFTIWYLLPKFLVKRKYALFFFATLATIIITSAMCAVTGDFVNLFIPNRKLTDPVWVRTITSSFDFTLQTLFFIAFALIGNWYEKDKRNMILERERLEAELVFLRAQMNPHFIFNALNSIYVLIDEDRKQASNALLKFSALLRYQLYDCSEQKMPLSKEIDFLKNYIELETLRNSSEVDISFDINQSESRMEIAPFILQPFVENAFKHVSRHHDSKNKIRIEARTNGSDIKLLVENTFDHDETQNHNGIGLRNVKRRLELIYPDKYRLHIKKENNLHTVNLELNVAKA